MYFVHYFLYSLGRFMYLSILVEHCASGAYYSTGFALLTISWLGYIFYGTNDVTASGGDYHWGFAPMVYMWPYNDRSAVGLIASGPTGLTRPLVLRTSGPSRVRRDEAMLSGWPYIANIAPAAHITLHASRSERYHGWGVFFWWGGLHAAMPACRTHHRLWRWWSTRLRRVDWRASRVNQMVRFAHQLTDALRASVTIGASPQWSMCGLTMTAPRRGRLSSGPTGRT
jgi:hypothetical protein